MCVRMRTRILLTVYIIQVAAMPADSKKEGKAAVYGMASSLPAGPVNELLKVYNDVVLDV